VCCYIEVRSEVGLLSRNVRIEGAVPPGVNAASSLAAGWGCHVRIARVTSRGVVYTGLAELSAIEIEGCGQDATMRHALHFENVPGNGSYVRGVSVGLCTLESS
jgi:hypothetical protein